MVNETFILKLEEDIDFNLQSIYYLVVILNLLWSEFAETNQRRFNLLKNTDLDHAWVVCDKGCGCREGGGSWYP